MGGKVKNDVFFQTPNCFCFCPDMSKKPFFCKKKGGLDVFFLQFFQKKGVRFMPIYDNMLVQNAHIWAVNKAKKTGSFPAHI